MAFASKYWALTFTLRDNNRDTAPVSVRLKPTDTLAEAEAMAAALAAELINLSNAAVITYSLTRVYKNDTIVAPPPESEVARKLVLMWSDADESQRSRMEIPSPKFAVEVDGTNVVPTNSAALAALVTVVTNGPAGSGNGPITNAGTDITKLLSAGIGHRQQSSQ